MGGKEGLVFIPELGGEEVGLVRLCVVVREGRERYVGGGRTLNHGIPCALLLGTWVSRSIVRIRMTPIGSCFSKRTPGIRPACTTCTSPKPLICPTSKITGHFAIQSTCLVVKVPASSLSAAFPCSKLSSTRLGTSSSFCLIFSGMPGAGGVGVLLFRLAFCSSVSR